MRCSTAQRAQPLLSIKDQRSSQLLRLSGSPTEKLRQADDHLKQDNGVQLGQFPQGDLPSQRPEDICFAGR